MSIATKQSNVYPYYSFRKIMDRGPCGGGAGQQHHPRSGGRGSCVLVVLVAGCCFLMHFVVNQVGSFWEEQVIQSLPLIVPN